jgi:hypothetical protein
MGFKFFYTWEIYIKFVRIRLQNITIFFYHKIIEATHMLKKNSILKEEGNFRDHNDFICLLLL